MHFDDVTLDLAEDVEQVPRIETDLESVSAIVGRHFLGSGSVLRRRDRQSNPIAVQRHFHGSRSLARDRGDAVYALLEPAGIDLKELVIGGGNHPAVIWESAVDQ